MHMCSIVQVLAISNNTIPCSGNCILSPLWERLRFLFLID